MLGPGGDLPVGLDPVDQLRAAVLQRQRVSVVFVELLKEPGTERGYATAGSLSGL